MSGLLTKQVSYIFGVKKHSKAYKDAFGVEIEVEPKPNVRVLDILPRNGAYEANWHTKADGSLRNGGYEIISKVMNEYEIDFAKATYNESFPWELFCTTSPRTSIHVHLNFSQNLLYEVITFYCHMLLIEDIIAEYSGKSRKGNLFALEAGKSLSNYNAVRDLVSKQDYRFVNNDNKYTSVNLESLMRLGTVEVRTMRGLTDIEDIFEWVQILLDIKKMCTHKTPAQIDFQSLLPKALIDFCEERNIDYREKINSQLSLFYDLMSSHPTGWDFTNPKCDWRNADGLQDYNVRFWGHKDVDTILSYDYYKKFLKETQRKPEPFRPNQPLPRLNNNVLVVVDDPRVRFVNNEENLLELRRGLPEWAQIIPIDEIMDEQPEVPEPNVELDDFDEDEDEELQDGHF